MDKQTPCKVCSAPNVTSLAVRSSSHSSTVINFLPRFSSRSVGSFQPGLTKNPGVPD